MTSTSPRCPSCGVVVTSDSQSCGACKAQLISTKCLSCSAVMFAGSRFCDHCGAIAPPAKIHLDEGGRECPRCTMSLIPARATGTYFHECTNCDGLWLDHGAFESLCMEGERQSALLTFVSSRKIPSEVLTKVRFLRCPSCRKQMTRSRVARSEGIIIDVCPEHGVWFDSRELPKILNFITRRGTESPELSEKLELLVGQDGIGFDSRPRDQKDPNSGNDMDQDAGQGIKKVIQSLFD